MMIWILAWFCFFVSLKRLYLLNPVEVGILFRQKKQRALLVSVVNRLREVEEVLVSGLVPEAHQWAQLESLAQPWGKLLMDCVGELRASGASLLPTLRRLRELAEDQSYFLLDAQAKSSLAYVQALSCAFLVPVLGIGLYLLMPAVASQLVLWLFCCTGSLIVMGVGAVWLLNLAESARWGGLEPKKRIWIMTALCAGERFLALVRVGTPADLAWIKTCDSIQSDAQELVLAWGYSIWESPKVYSQPHAQAELLILQLGIVMRKSIQMSLMEGKPCTERVESALLALRQNLKIQIDRELSILGTRALKPLFVCVTPALLILLFSGFWLTLRENFEGLFHVL